MVWTSILYIISFGVKYYLYYIMRMNWFSVFLISFFILLLGRNIGKFFDKYIASKKVQPKKTIRFYGSGHEEDVKKQRVSNENDKKQQIVSTDEESSSWVKYDDYYVDNAKKMNGINEIVSEFDNIKYNKKMNLIKERRNRRKLKKRRPSRNNKKNIRFMGNNKELNRSLYANRYNKPVMYNADNKPFILRPEGYDYTYKRTEGGNVGGFSTNKDLYINKNGEDVFFDQFGREYIYSREKYSDGEKITRNPKNGMVKNIHGLQLDFIDTNNNSYYLDENNKLVFIDEHTDKDLILTAKPDYIGIKGQGLYPSYVDLDNNPVFKSIRGNHYHFDKDKNTRVRYTPGGPSKSRQFPKGRQFKWKWNSEI